MKVPTVGLVVLLAAGCVAGCRKPCNPAVDRSRCEGNTMVTCPKPGVDQMFGANQWVRAPCEAPSVCVDRAGDVFCGLSSHPSPACPDGGGLSCDGTDLVVCHADIEVFRGPCLSCTPSATGGPVCRGGADSPCKTNADCAAPMWTCKAGQCERR
jgi:hypothetical protein